MKIRVQHGVFLSAALAAAVTAPAVSAKGVPDAVAEVLLRLTFDILTQPHPVAPPPGPVVVPVEYAPQTMAVAPLQLQEVITPDPSARLKDQEITYQSLAPHEPFRVRDFSRTFVTAVGGSAKDATELVMQDQLQDPAVIVADDLAQAVSRHYSGHYIGLAPAPSTAPQPAAAPGVPLGSGFLVEVYTLHWEMKAVSINPLHISYGMNHYGVYYDAKFRLLDKKDGSVLASGKCDSGPSASDPAPSYEEALADGGKRLKQMLEKAGHECALSAEEEYLGIRMPERDSGESRIQ